MLQTSVCLQLECIQGNAQEYFNKPESNILWLEKHIGHGKRHVRVFTVDPMWESWTKSSWKWNRQFENLYRPTLC